MIVTEYEKSPPGVSGMALSCSGSGINALVGFNDTRIAEKRQDGFSEGQELKKRFEPKKADSLRLSASYSRLGFSVRSRRVSDCGSFLSFRHEVFADGCVSDRGQLYQANFCRDRLCPMCSWRRSLKLFGQVSKVIDRIKDDYRFLFLTLTIPNCEPDELASCLDSLFVSWRRFSRMKSFKTVVKGYFRVLEVTRNNSANTYHPHFHVILAVSRSYNRRFNYYIPHASWLEMWQNACRDPSISQVNIKFCKVGSDGSIASSVAEVAKYSVKSSDFLSDDICLTDQIVSDLQALSGHRLAQFGGIFKSVHHDLNFDDFENGDLVHVSDDDINPLVSYLILRYGWSAGVYKLSRAEFISVGGA